MFLGITPVVLIGFSCFLDLRISTSAAKDSQVSRKAQKLVSSVQKVSQVPFDDFLFTRTLVATLPSSLFLPFLLLPFLLPFFLNNITTATTTAAKVQCQSHFSPASMARVEMIRRVLWNWF